MTMFPNCREDEYYNEKYLDKMAKGFIEGFDWAVNDIVSLFENNLEVFPDLLELLEDNKAVIMEGKAVIVTEHIRKWAEMQRNVLITSMIDGYTEEEYQELRGAADASCGA